MNINGKTSMPFTFELVESGSEIRLELTNKTDHLLRCIEILTIFLKDEDSLGGSSRVHIKFEAIKHLQPQETAVVSHRTWIDGQPRGPEHNQLARLKMIAGELKPYVLDISWEDPEGKSRFQRIPLGH